MTTPFQIRILPANLAILGLVGLAAILFAQAPDTYQRIVQEDEILEWTTFWSFVGASIGYGHLSLRAPSVWSWRSLFLAGLALFCALVALEEISWGQRILGYRPPEYFLAENYQQELNLHNTLGDSVRHLGFLGVCWGYGVALPIVDLWGSARGWLDRFGVVSPAWGLCPSFAAAGLLFQIYPWTHSGEWAEAMLGGAMLFAAVAEGLSKEDSLGWPISRATLVAILLAVVTVVVGSMRARDDPGRVAQAERELAALRVDIGAARTRTRCGIHKRVYTMVEAYHQDHLFEGEYASLVASGLPEDRARYFLDPWNSPYWLQHVCSEDRRRRAIFVYSFGPNRKRESSDWEIEGDDLGAWISRPRLDEGG